MGFNITKAFTRAVGLSDKAIPTVNAIFPAFIATNVAGNALLKVGAAVSAAGNPQPKVSQSQSPYTPPGQTTYYFQPQGSYYPQYQPTYSGSYLGGDQWDYSTYSGAMIPSAVTTYSQPVYNYSASGAGEGVPWEEVISLGLLLL